MPAAPKRGASRNARITRRIRSVNVAVMNWPMQPAPRSTPSAASFSEMST